MEIGDKKLSIEAPIIIFERFLINFGRWVRSGAVVPHDIMPLPNVQIQLICALAARELTFFLSLCRLSRVFSDASAGGPLNSPVNSVVFMSEKLKVPASTGVPEICQQPGKIESRRRNRAKLSKFLGCLHLHV